VGVAVAVAVPVIVPVGVSTGVDVDVRVGVGVRVGVWVAVGDDCTAGDPTAITGCSVVGVACSRPTLPNDRPENRLPPTTLPAATPAPKSSISTIPASQTHAGTRRRARAGAVAGITDAAGTAGAGEATACPIITGGGGASILRVLTLGVGGAVAALTFSAPQAGTGTPSASAISAALCQRWERASSSAFKIASSVRLLTLRPRLRRGLNCSGSEIRIVAVSGAWPASAW